MLGEKLRFRFSKTGTLRLLSHHDLMRCVERMLRRAELPFRQTQGFHPGPRLIFALSLPLGADARNDVVELELTAPRDSDDVLGRLNAQSPDGLHFHAARAVPLKAVAVPRRAVYRVAHDDSWEVATNRLAGELLESRQVWVERLHPQPRRVDIRPFIRGVSVTPLHTTFDLWVTPNGSARGDELVRLLGLTDVVAGGSILTRVDLEIHDEVGPEPGDRPPTAKPETAPLEHVAAVAADGENDAARAVWGTSPDGPAVE